MTDNDIIKALECCSRADEGLYGGLTYKGESLRILIKDALDLINRQKAEIERLKKENKILSANSDTAFQDGLNEAQGLYAEQIKNEVRAEAITEFAERLKAKAKPMPCYSHLKIVYTSDIDQIAKEMKEGVNNEG